MLTAMAVIRRGDGLALLAVAIFAGTYPATRVVVAGGLGPVTNGVLRTCLAGLCAALALGLLRIPVPPRAEWRGILLVGGGTLLFPCGVGWAVAVLPAGQVGVAMALLPLATTAYAAMRGEPLPGWRFWSAGALAGVLVAGVAARHATGSGVVAGLPQAAAAVVLAMIAAAVTYVEGGRLARTRPAWQVISWGLVGCLPLTLPVAMVWGLGGPSLGVPAWLGLLYGGLASAWIGFFPWFAAIARLGAARAGQIQYLQPFIALAYGALLLGETVDAGDLLCAGGVVGAIAWGRARAIGSVLPPFAPGPRR